MKGRSQQGGRDAGDLVRELVRPEVRALSAYHVPDPGDLVKLDAMENPYPWPGELLGGWLDALRSVHANRYPDPGAARLKARLGEAMGVPAGLDILLGNGSDELIQLVLMAVAGPGRTVLAPEPTFVMYHLLARMLGLEYVGVPLDGGDFSLDLPAMLAAIERHRPAVVFLAYPNNPTGNLFARDGVDAILQAAPGLVVVDEAYTPFAQSSYLGNVSEHPNLLVMRTVSKMGLAGLRLGWLAGDPAWTGELNKLRLPYNVNVLTQVSAGFALEHKDVLDDQTARIRGEREALYAALAAVPGLKVWPSRANFILFRTLAAAAPDVFEGLKGEGVLIKNLHGSNPALDQCLRVTVGTPEENRTFLDSLGRVLALL